MLRADDVAVERCHQGILADVSLQVPRGTLTALIGPPRSGKTTLLRVFAGLEVPTRGRVACDGALLNPTLPAAVRAWQQHVGMAFQNDALFDDLSVFDNVALPLRQRHLPPERVVALVNARLDDVALLDDSHKRPSQLSGGMRKRLGVARATVHGPTVGLFDEPTAGLDPLSASRILELIVRLTRNNNMATIVVSHDLAVLLPMASRVAMLVRGQLVYHGPATTVAESPRADVRQFVTGEDAGPL